MQTLLSSFTAHFSTVTVIAAFGCKIRHCSLIFLKRGSIDKTQNIELHRILFERNTILVFWEIVFIRGK